MRPVLLIVAAAGLVLVGAAAASVTGKSEPDSGGVSTIALSRCAGMAGIEMREADPAFGQLMLDGAPWLVAQHDDDAIVVNGTGTGTVRRRNGTTAPFRFFCVLDEAGHAKMFRVIPAAGEGLPASRLIEGVAKPAGVKSPLARGSELRVQLFDIKNDPKGELLAEQVVRSGWEVAVPFALRVPAGAKLTDRQLVISARIVRARSTIYGMAQPRALTSGDLQRPVVLDLSP